MWTHWVGIAQSAEDLNRAKDGGRRKSPLSSCPHELGHLIILSCPQTATDTLTCPGSQAFGPKQICTSHSPRSPACRQQIVGFLYLQNYVKQFLQ